MEKYSEQILNHPFAKECFDDIVHLAKTSDTPRNFSEFSQSFHSGKLSGPDQYFYPVFSYIVRIRDCFERLDHIRIFISHPIILKKYREGGINQTNYIQYHYSNWAVTFVGIFDITLHLTNNVFRLGIPEKRCHPQLIIQNSWVRSRGIDKILQNLNSRVEPFREPRNLFIHRGISQMDDLLTTLGAYDLLNERGMVENDTMLKIINHSKVKLAYREKISEILNKLIKQEEAVFNTSMELLTSLHPVYKFWKEKIP